MKNEIELSIIIPTYNENKRIARTLNEYLLFFDNSNINYEIIVSDLSDDGTKTIISELQKRHKNLCLLNLEKRGKGLAVYEGFKIAKGKYLSFTDADNAVGPEEFYKLYKYIDRYDAVIGSRGLARSNVVYYHQSLFRRLGSLVLGVMFVKILFRLKIKDTQCGAKIFRREKILKILPKMRITNSVFDIELLWRFKKIGSIKEFPIRWVDDRFSNFRWPEVFSEFIWLLRVRFRL